MTAGATDGPRRGTRAGDVGVHPMNGWRRKGCKLRLAVCAVALVLAAGGGPAAGDEPTATLEVSSSTATDALGLSFAEGVLRFRGCTYTAMLRGVEPGAEATGVVANLSAVREIEGTYTPAAGVLRNEHGVVLTFEPPLVLSQGRLQLTLRTRIYPKSSNGLHGRFD